VTFSNQGTQREGVFTITTERHEGPSTITLVEISKFTILLGGGLEEKAEP